MRGLSDLSTSIVRAALALRPLIRRLGRHLLPQGEKGRGALAAIAAVACLAGAAADPAERLSDPVQEARARDLFREVRCLVCQNESIDDSEAALAGDLRQVVRDQVKQGRSDPQIRAFLVERYGEFVLLKPPFSAGNALLWATPGIVLILGGVLMALLLRRRPASVADGEDTPALSQVEEARLQVLLKDE
jgi:cytochrome c-type biogenesis protein CcmH